MTFDVEIFFHELEELNQVNAVDRLINTVDDFLIAKEFTIVQKILHYAVQQSTKLRFALLTSLLVITLPYKTELSVSRQWVGAAATARVFDEGRDFERTLQGLL